MVAKVGLAVLIIAAIILGSIFYKGYLDQDKAADALQTKITNDKNTASTVSTKNKALEAEIQAINARAAKIQSDIEAVKVTVLPRYNPNLVVEEIVRLGSINQVTVIPLAARDWSSVKIGTHDYQVLKMNVEVNGDQDRVINFVEAVQDSQYQPMIIESISLKKEKPESILPVTPEVDPDLILAKVETLPANNILTDSATLNGNLVSLGATNSSMRVSFQYTTIATDTNITYINTTAPEVVLAPGVFSTILYGLEPNTLYYFRAIAEGTATKYGSDMAFWTLVTPPTAPTDSITNVNLSLAVYAR